MELTKENTENGYEGLKITCPHCEEPVFLSLLISHGECPRCKRDASVHVTWHTDEE